MSYDPKACGARIRQLRKQSGYTQEVLAGKLSIDRSLLSHIEAGKRECSVSLLVQLSEIFSVSLEMLAFGKGKAVLDTIQLESDLDGAIALLMRMKDGLH